MLPIENKFFEYFVSNGTKLEPIANGITTSKPNAISKIVQILFSEQLSNNGEKTSALIKQVYFDRYGDIKTAYQANGENEYLKFITIENNRMNFAYIENKVYDALM